MRFRPQLRTVLLVVNLTILLLPLGSIYALRIYETELVRQTESNLLAQGTVISMVYRDRLLNNLGPRADTYAIEAPSQPMIGSPEPGKFKPLLPQLNMAEAELRSPIGEAGQPESPPDAAAAEAGSELANLLREAQNAALAGIRIVDTDGTVVASTGAETGLSLIHREEVRRALKGEVVSLLYMRSQSDEPSPLGPFSRRTRYRVHVAVPVAKDMRVYGAVVLMRTPLDASKAIYIHRRPIAYGALILFFVVLAMTVMTSLTISRPVKRLIEQIERFGRSGKNDPDGFKAPRALEFGTMETDRLSEAFSVMSKKLEQRSDYIQTFVSNVSHGFKTPLASTHAAVELLKDHISDMTLEERNRFLDIIDDDTARLERLVTRLIELARADVVKSTGEKTEIIPLLEDLVDRYRSYGRKIKIRANGGGDSVPINRETLESIITNLIDNAYIHGGTDVEVILKSGKAAVDGSGCLEISIEDDGKGISAANAEKIFRPFFTTAKEAGGSGLGLSIVQSLLKAHGGDIELAPSERGACFKLRLPEQPMQLI